VQKRDRAGSVAGMLAGMHAQRARAVAARARVRALLFDRQRDALDDTSQFVSVLCSRRAGKTAFLAAYLVDGALSESDTSCLYLGLTRDEAKRLCWRWIKRVCKDARIAAAFNESALTVTLANGSVIYVRGADAKQDEMEKFLGGEYSRVAIDEGASYRIDLEHLISVVLEPALIDRGGRLAIAGTPGHTRNFFYDVTEGDATGWSRHAWNSLDNPHIAERWKAKLADILATKPYYIHTPEYAWNYSGKWAVDARGLVYRFDRMHLVDAPPERLEGRTLAIDLGWDNATSFCLGGWEQYSQTLYILRCEKRGGMLLDEVAEHAAKIKATPGPYVRTVIDGAARQSVEQMRQRYGLVADAADKSDKARHIDMMNADLAHGRVKVVRGRCSDLLVEWTGADEDGVPVRLDGGNVPLIWDRRKLAAKPPRREEDPACANDASDAALYMWRESMQHLEPPAPPPAVDRDSEEWARAAHGRVARRLQESEFD